MNDNEYGGFSYNRNDDGKKELRISEKDNMEDVGRAFRESNMNPDVQDIDQITVVAGGEKREDAGKPKTSIPIDITKINLERMEQIDREYYNPRAKQLHLSKPLTAVIVILGLAVAAFAIYCKFMGYY